MYFLSYFGEMTVAPVPGETGQLWERVVWVI